jgi:hypothetical protein
MSSLPENSAPWDQETPTKLDEEAPAQVEVHPNFLSTLTYCLGILEGAVEVTISRLDGTDEEDISDGLKTALNKVKKLTADHMKVDKEF